jgi:hypothetical protein
MVNVWIEDEMITDVIVLSVVIYVSKRFTLSYILYVRGKLTSHGLTSIKHLQAPLLLKVTG